MSSTVSMKLRAIALERVFLDPPAGLTHLYACLTHDVPVANSLGWLSEPLIGDYARVAIPLGSTHWASSGYGEVINTQVFSFPMATLDWGLLQGWALTDDPDFGQGDTWAVGSLQTPIYVVAGMVPTGAPSTISVGIYD